MAGAEDSLIFPEPLGGGYVEDFCYVLRAEHGFEIGPIEIEQILRLLAVLEASGRRIETATDAFQLLSPILAKDPEDQATLKQVISNAFKDAGKPPIESPEGGGDAAANEPFVPMSPGSGPGSGLGPEQNLGDVLGPLQRSLALAFPVLGVAGVLGLYMWIRQNPPVGPGPECQSVTDEPATGGSEFTEACPEITQPDVSLLDQSISALLSTLSNTTTLLLFLLVIAILGCLGYMLLQLRRLAAERDGIPDTEDRFRPVLAGSGPIFFTSPQGEAQIAKLTRHDLVGTRKLDAPETAIQTVSKGGYLTLVYQDRKVQPEFTILFDRRSMRDQFQILVEDLRTAIAGQHIHVDRFDYTNLPERPVEIDREGVAVRAVSFDEIVAKTEARHILLVANPDDLITGARRLIPWLAKLARHGEVTVLSTIPLGQVRRPLAALRRVGVAVHPAWDFDAEGSDAIDSFRASQRMPSDAALTSDFAPSKAEQAVLAGWIRRNLSNRAREFLAALSIYPEISVAMTRAMLKRLSTTDRRPLVDGGVMGEVVGMQWLRAARMPDWAMDLVRRDIPDRRRRELRDDVQNSLEPDPSGRDAISLSYDTSVFNMSFLRGFDPQQGRLTEAVVGRPSWRQTELAVYIGHALRGQGTNATTMRRIALLLSVVAAALTLTYTAQVLANTLLAQVMAFATLAVGILLHMLALASIGRELVQTLNWVASGGLLCVFAQLLGSTDIADVLAPAAVMFIVFLARGSPRTARSIHDVMRGSSWVMGTAIFFAVSVTVISVDASLGLVAAFPLLSGALYVGLFALILAWPLRAPLRDVVLLTLLAGAFASQGVYKFFAIPEALAGFDSVVTGHALAVTALAVAVFAHLDWRGAGRPSQAWYAALANGALFGLLTFLPAVIAGEILVWPVTYFGFLAFLVATVPVERIGTVRRNVLWLVVAPLMITLGIEATNRVVSPDVPEVSNEYTTLSISALLAVPLARLALPGLFRPWRVSVFYHEWPATTLRQRLVAVAGGFFFNLCTFRVVTGPLSLDFTFLAIPAAAFLAYTLGRAGFWAVAIGGLFFWVQLDFGGGGTSQTPAVYFACLLVARVVGCAELRHEIIQTAALTRWQLIYLTLGFALSFSYYFGATGLVHRPQPYLEIVLILIGLSKVSLRQIAPWLFWCWVASVVVGTVRFYYWDALNIRPTLASTADILALAACFVAGRALRELLENPLAFDGMVGRIAQWLFTIIILDQVVFSLDLEFEIWAFFLSVDLVPEIGIIVGYVALGLVGGWRGVFYGCLVSTIAFFVLPAVSSFLLPLVLFVDIGFLFAGLAYPGSSVGFQYDLGGGVSVGLGYPMFSVFGLWAQRALIARTGVTERELLALERKTRRDELNERWGSIGADLTEDVEPGGTSNGSIASGDSSKRAGLAETYLDDTAPSQKGDGEPPFVPVPLDAYREDRAALRARGRISSGGHPVLRALWLDRVAVFSGLFVFFNIPLAVVLFLATATVDEPIIIEPIPVPLDENAFSEPSTPSGGATTANDGLPIVVDPLLSDQTDPNAAQQTVDPDQATGSKGVEPLPVEPVAPEQQTVLPEENTFEDPVIPAPIIVEETPALGDVICTIWPFAC